MVILAGIDLAWTPHHESGICLVSLVCGKPSLMSLDARVVSPAALAAELDSSGPAVVAAIDAPLVVTAARTAERELGHIFGRYRAPAHSASLRLLESTGRMAGPYLGRLLEAAGFSLDPWALLPASAGRHALEVYPHAAHVRLFGLDERIPYKRKRGRDMAFVRGQLQRYQALLLDILRRDLPGLTDDSRVGARLDPAATCARGAALKRLEDELDALTCAYAAWHAWVCGSSGLELFGNAADGHIAVPRPMPAAAPELS